MTIKYLRRLAGARMKISLQVGSKNITKGFGSINSWEIIQEHIDGRMERLKVKLSDWVYEVMLNNEVLTLNCDYFLIPSPLEENNLRIIQ